MNEKHPLAELGIVRGPFEDWRHKPNQPLPNTFQMIDWLRMMANLIEREHVENRGVRAEIEEVIVGLNEWDALKHDDADSRWVVYQVQYQPKPGVYDTLTSRNTLEEAQRVAEKHHLGRVVRVTTHRRFVTEDVEGTR